MDRNNGPNRYTGIRRAGQQQHQQASSATTTSSLPSTANNNPQHVDPINHHHARPNSSTSTMTSNTPYASANNTTGGYASSASSTTNRDGLTQHDELIRYIREAWTRVNEQGARVVYHREPEHQLKNFKPFNLEEYWDQRHFQNVHVSQGQQ